MPVTVLCAHNSIWLDTVTQCCLFSCDFQPWSISDEVHATVLDLSTLEYGGA
jgi:hypothetical protein